MKAYVLSGSWGCYECRGESEAMFVAKSQASAEAKLKQIKVEDAKQAAAAKSFGPVWAQVRAENPPPPITWSGSISIDEPVYKEWNEKHGAPWDALCLRLVIEKAEEIALAHGVEAFYDEGRYPHFRPSAIDYTIEEVECEA